MAHFYGTVQGNRQQTSRCGSKSSGITSVAQGWNLGGRVNMHHLNNNDHLTLSITGGAKSSFELSLPSVYLNLEGKLTSDDPLMKELLEQQK